MVGAGKWQCCRAFLKIIFNIDSSASPVLAVLNMGREKVHKFRVPVSQLRRQLSVAKRTLCACYSRNLGYLRNTCVNVRIVKNFN